PSGCPFGCRVSGWLIGKPGRGRIARGEGSLQCFVYAGRADARAAAGGWLGDGLGPRWLRYQRLRHQRGLHEAVSRGCPNHETRANESGDRAHDWSRRTPRGEAGQREAEQRRQGALEYAQIWRWTWHSGSRQRRGWRKSRRSCRRTDIHGRIAPELDDFRRRARALAIRV